jgi:hypothetical protein
MIVDPPVNWVANTSTAPLDWSRCSTRPEKLDVKTMENGDVTLW